MELKERESAPEILVDSEERAWPKPHVVYAVVIGSGFFWLTLIAWLLGDL
jgi:hypothetical protein